MSLTELLSQAYYSGTLTLAIVLLALAIIAYPTLRKQSNIKPHSKRK